MSYRTCKTLLTNHEQTLDSSGKSQKIQQQISNAAGEHHKQRS